jgi:hypothetical protein
MVDDEAEAPLCCFIIAMILAMFQMFWMNETGRTIDVFGNVYVNGEFDMFETSMYGGRAFDD